MWHILNDELSDFVVVHFLFPEASMSHFVKRHVSLKHLQRLNHDLTTILQSVNPLESYIYENIIILWYIKQYGSTNSSILIVYMIMYTCKNKKDCSFDKIHMERDQELWVDPRPFRVGIGLFAIDILELAMDSPIADQFKKQIQFLPDLTVRGGGFSIF